METTEVAGELAEPAVTGAYDKIQSMVEGFGSAAPNIAIAAVVFLFFYIVARCVAWLVKRVAARRDRANLGDLLGGLAKAGVLLFGGLVAITVIFPSVKPADAIGALGLSSVAIGFAFKDILQNWLAGLLILVRRPYAIGDWIEVDGEVGSVERIETRATLLKTFDGKLTLIPNSDLYTGKVTVLTHYAARRTEYDVGVGYADDIDGARDAILTAIKSVDGVLADPEPVVMEWGLDASWVTLRARWWTDSRGALGPRRAVIRAIKLALDEKGIDMPFETQVHLFHDQTEEFDGDRTRQREGWPAGENPPKPLAAVTSRKDDAKGAKEEEVAAEAA
ncbi:MAG: mechanosensitive ion channel family protein [Pseudomonadota bacterium]